MRHLTASITVGFLACFAQEFGVPSLAPSTFDAADILKQKSGELPRKYYYRMSQYFNDKLPLAAYIQEEEVRTTAANVMANNVTAAAKEEAIRAAIIASQEKVLAEVTGHLLKQTSGSAASTGMPRRPPKPRPTG